jgi:hypothetical protein
MGRTTTHLELAASTSDAHSRLISHDLSCNHSDRLTLCGIDLARHDATARFVLWKAELAEATTRPRSQESYVVPNLHQGASDDVEGTMSLD